MLHFLTMLFSPRARALARFSEAAHKYRKARGLYRSALKVCAPNNNSFADIPTAGDRAAAESARVEKHIAEQLLLEAHDEFQALCRAHANKVLT